MFEKMGHADDLGIEIAGKPTLDMKKLQAWKGGVVNKLTGGVRTLLKGNGVEIIEGSAKLEKSGPDGHRITVTGKTGTQTIIAKNVVLATGSRPFEIPGFKIDNAGRVFVENTGTDLNSIAPHTVWNAALSAAGQWAGAHTTLTLRGFNLGDLRYATTGYMDFDSRGALVPHVMPAATRSWLLEARVDW